jgi:hypothetical protein
VSPFRLVTFGLIVLLMASVGCSGGAAEKQIRAAELRALGNLYHYCNIAASVGKPPSGPDDLDTTDIADDDPETEAFNKRVVQAVRDGKYVLIWDVKFDPSKLPAGSADIVLGYEKDVPTAGGQVLMLDTSVKQMTADEFQKAPKAKK